ncbi:MAG: DUF2339 domain-containing protein [Chitinivibrionia bacterium]|nr:DUF2339 domain-containing protein [Chitinivibrionia bacterium]
MNTIENLRNIVGAQKELADNLEAQRRALEESDVVKENAALKSEIQKLRADFEKINAQVAALGDENSGLKNALYEHIFNEKSGIVTNTSEKLNIYFRSEIDGEINKLSAIEQNVKSRIKNIKDNLAKNNIDIEKEFGEKLDELSLLVDKNITEARLKTEQLSTPFSQKEREQLDALKNEKISGEQIRAIAKKNNFEKFIGLNVLNITGIILLLIGTITAIRYTYTNLSDLFKGISIFAFGAIMLVFGEILNRKKPNIFSLGISSGGVAILYTALVASFFVLQIIDMYPTIAICVLLTVGAFLLSDRYNSQIIATFTLVGGYLPIIFAVETPVFTYGIMAYFALLNLFALSVSWKRKWRVMTFTGLSLNIIGTAYICLIMVSEFVADVSAFGKAFNIIYAAFAFLIYAAIPIISTYRAKTIFKKSDVWLFAINAIFGSLIIYQIFARFDLSDFNGLLAVVFAAFYLFLGKFIEKIFKNEEKNIKVLFYLTGLAFVALFIPLQFERAWMSLGWLAEGVILAVYGILKNEKNFKKAGLVIYMLCLCAFVLSDVLFDAIISLDSAQSRLFVWKYSAITLGSLSILGSYMYKKITAGAFVSRYKYFAIINAQIYAIYIIHKKLGDIFYAIYQNDPIFQYPNEPIFQIDYLISAASITATFLIAYVVARIKTLASTGIKILSVIFYCIAINWMFINNANNTPISKYYMYDISTDFGVMAAGTIILAALGVLSIFAVQDAMKIIISKQKKGIEFLPFVVSGYFVALLSQNLITQYNLSFSSAAISVIYVIAAFAFIVFGFMRRFAFTRRFGLALAIFAVAKLFIIDIASMTQGYRILSYFALGITILAISFVYQYFSKRLELTAKF